MRLCSGHPKVQFETIEEEGERGGGGGGGGGGWGECTVGPRGSLII